MSQEVLNSRERLFFKNVKLHKSMSYQKREDKENVDKMKQKYMEELMKKQDEKAKMIYRNKSIFYRLIRYIVK